MNYVDMISPADFVGCPAKVRWSTMFFLKEIDFCMTFVSAVSQSACGLAHE